MIGYKLCRIDHLGRLASIWMPVWGQATAFPYQIGRATSQAEQSALDGIVYGPMALFRDLDSAMWHIRFLAGPRAQPQTAEYLQARLLECDYAPSPEQALYIDGLRLPLEETPDGTVLASFVRPLRIIEPHEALARATWTGWDDTGRAHG